MSAAAWRWTLQHDDEHLSMKMSALARRLTPEHEDEHPSMKIKTSAWQDQQHEGAGSVFFGPLPKSQSKLSLNLLAGKALT